MSYPLTAEDLLERLPHYPTSGQEEALRRLADYLHDDYPNALFLLRGYAGTGKTFLLRAISEAARDSGITVELLATTGRAAKVLSATCAMPATTIHRRIYRPSSASIEEGGSYRLGQAAERTLFIVDEASMIAAEGYEPSPFGSGNLLDDLLEYVFSGDDAKLILVGDDAQLPPVGSHESIALSPQKLHEIYGLRVYSAELREVVRQTSESGILEQATYIRQLIEQHQHLSEGMPIPLTLTLGKQADLRVLRGEDVLDELDSCYRRYGREDVLIVTPSNKRALQHNLGIRSRIFDYDSELVRGEQLIVARNNYYYAQRKDRADFIANGEIIELKRTYQHHYIYGLHFVDATIYLPERGMELEARILVSGLGDEKAQRSHDERLALYNALAHDYQEGAGTGIVDTRRAIRRDPYWGALEVKYGYAVTAHKAQGGQWSCVFVDLGLVGVLPTDLGMLRWLYTALTRATERVYLINPPRGLIPAWDENQ
ncbi:MAG: AAA family ATPase [Porphyromonas sp.]|nr:AAA family ATPase [Porphyromonas sp.]